MNQLSTHQYLKFLKLLYVTLIFGQLILAIAALFLKTEGYISQPIEEIKFLPLILLLLVFSGLYEGKRVYQKKLETARKQSTLSRKLAHYRMGIVLQFIFWIVPSLFAIASYIMAGNWIYLILSGIVITFFIMNPPGIRKARKDLDL